jgi:hypothetical protein
MFFKKRVEIQKEFENLEFAKGFAAGLEFSGNRDFRIKEVKDDDDKIVVIMEKLERSKV